MKRTFLLSLAPAMIVFSAVFLGQGRSVPVRIAIVHSSAAAEGRAVQEGLLHRLAEEGYDASTLQWKVYNIDNDRAKATEIAARLASERVDLIVPIGNIAALALAQEIRYIPIVFAAVQDPVGSGIVRDMKYSGNNTTGTSTRVPLESILAALSEVRPFRALGILYSPYEMMSLQELYELRQIQKEFRFPFTLLESPVETPAEIETSLPALLDQVDSLFVSSSFIVNSRVHSIADSARSRRIPTVTVVSSLVESGLLLGVSARPEKIGELTALKVVRVLQGVRPTEIPIGTATHYDLTINADVARTLGWNGLTSPAFRTLPLSPSTPPLVRKS